MASDVPLSWKGLRKDLSGRGIALPYLRQCSSLLTKSSTRPHRQYADTRRACAVFWNGEPAFSSDSRHSFTAKLVAPMHQPRKGLGGRRCKKRIFRSTPKTFRPNGQEGATIAGSSEPVSRAKGFVRRPGPERPNGARLVGRSMKAGQPIFGHGLLKRALALVACATLLYFSGGGTLFHQHSDGLEKACHVCQSLHVPALAPASLDLIVAPELITR